MESSDTVQQTVIRYTSHQISLQSIKVKNDLAKDVLVNASQMLSDFFLKAT